MSVAFVSDAVELAVPPSVRALADGSTNVVKRGRRVSVVPGSLKSARESQEREKERELKAKIQNRKAKNELRQKLASNVLNLREQRLWKKHQQRGAAQSGPCERRCCTRGVDW